MPAARIIREIFKIKEYKNKWKITTNYSQFTITPVASIKHKPVTINNKNIDIEERGKILGFTITNREIKQHANGKISRVKSELTTLKIIPLLTKIKI